MHTHAYAYTPAHMHTYVLVQGHAGYQLAPYCSPFGSPESRKCCGGPLEALEWMLVQQVHPGDVAAIILEPILGEGGFLTPPPGFMEGVGRAPPHTAAVEVVVVASIAGGDDGVCGFCWGGGGIVLPLMLFSGGHALSSTCACCWQKS